MYLKTSNSLILIRLWTATTGCGISSVSAKSYFFSHSMKKVFFLNLGGPRLVGPDAKCDFPNWDINNTC